MNKHHSIYYTEPCKSSKGLWMMVCSCGERKSSEDRDTHNCRLDEHINWIKSEGDTYG